MASEHERRVSVGEEWDENFDVNFVELRIGEVRRIPIPRTSVNNTKYACIMAHYAKDNKA